MSGACTGSGLRAVPWPICWGADFAQLAEAHKLYTCHDFILEHKTALFDHLTERWKDLFNPKFDVLLYDLTSSYFEPFAGPRVSWIA